MVATFEKQALIPVSTFILNEYVSPSLKPFRLQAIGRVKGLMEGPTCKRTLREIQTIEEEKWKR